MSLMSNNKSILKKIYLINILFIVFFSNSILAQDTIQGIATYIVKNNSNEFIEKIKSSDANPQIQKELEELFNSQLKKTYILSFNKEISFYEEEKVQYKNENKILFPGLNEKALSIYKDLKNKYYIQENEFMDKNFVVKDSLKKIEWKLERDSMNINGYTCFKATAYLNQPINNIKMPAISKPNSQLITNETTHIENGKNVQNTKQITAWYTPEIVSNQGPENYWGLPGLILYVTDGSTSISCVKLQLNLINKIPIPKIKKSITQAKYDEIVTLKKEEIHFNLQNTKEMKQMSFER